jgi:hypothetical protein
VNHPSALQKRFAIQKKLVNMTPMLNSSRATKKIGRKIRWDAEGLDAVFLFGQEFCGELEQKQKSTKATLATYNTISKVLINELTKSFLK